MFSNIFKILIIILVSLQKLHKFSSLIVAHLASKVYLHLPSKDVCIPWETLLARAQAHYQLINRKAHRTTHSHPHNPSPFRYDSTTFAHLFCTLAHLTFAKRERNWTNERFFVYYNARMTGMGIETSERARTTNSVHYVLSSTIRLIARNGDVQMCT